MNIPTLFVIGAGASAGYNLPLGSDLAKKIVRNLGHTKPSPDQYGGTKQAAAIEMELRDLALRLQESRSPTIDAFLRHSENREYLLSAMANVIWEAEDEALKYSPDSSDDWLAWLYHNRLKREPGRFVRNEFSVVSFNYDRLPRAILSAMMCNLFDAPIEECIAVVDSPVCDGIPRFTHIHGCINAPLKARSGNREDARRVRSWFTGRSATLDCSGLSTMFDTSHADRVRHQIANLVRWADRIIFLGIGYHQEMLDLFNIEGGTGVQSWLKSKEFVGGTAFKLDRGTQGRLSSWGGDRFAAGTRHEGCTAFLARCLAE